MSETKKYKDRDWLFDQYWNEKKDSVEIGKECGVVPGTIRYNMKKFNIKRRTTADSIRGKYTGENSPSWKGGKYLTKDGYFRTLKPDHPRATTNGRVFEHILVAEKMLGRILNDSEVVHHINMNKSDNRPENLFVCTKGLDNNAHKSYNNLCEELMKRKIIDFNKGEYYITNKKD